MLTIPWEFLGLVWNRGAIPALKIFTKAAAEGFDRGYFTDSKVGLLLAVATFLLGLLTLIHLVKLFQKVLYVSMVVLFLWAIASMVFKMLEVTSDPDVVDVVRKFIGEGGQAG